MILDEDKGLRDRLFSLKQQHRSLDEAIVDMTSGVSFDQIKMQRLKKEKLQLKDAITRIEDELYPDIIA